MTASPKFHCFSRLTVALLACSLLGACSELDQFLRPDAKPETDQPKATRTAKTLLRQGHACCNLRYAGDLISETAYGQQSFIAAGTPVLIRRLDGRQAEVEIDGKPMRIAGDGSRSPAAFEQWLTRLIVAEDPRSKLQAYPPAVRMAITKGQVFKGMTREQVSMALGPPPGDAADNAAQSRYWWANYVPVYVHWDKVGNLVRLTGAAEAVAALSYKSR